MKMLYVLLLATTNAMASLVNLQGGEFFMGEELYNEHRTGKICFVTIQNVQPLVSKGIHCNQIQATIGFSTHSELNNNDGLSMASRITNRDTPEYKFKRSCAERVPGSNADILGISEEGLYNQLFSWNGKVDGYSLDYFVTFGYESKQPVRTRLHVMNWYKEYNLDCINLKKN